MYAEYNIKSPQLAIHSLGLSVRAVSFIFHTLGPGMSRRRSKGRTEEPTDSTNSNDMLVIELKRWLTDHDIDIPYGSKKPDLVRLRNEHLATMASQAHRSQIKADSPPPAFESDSIIERACEEEEFSFLSNQEPRRSEVRDIDISSKSKDDHRSKMHEKFSRRYAYRAKPFPGIPHRHSREGVSKDMVKRRKLSWEKEPSAPDYSKIYQGIKATPEYQKDIADERIKLEKMLEQELMVWNMMIVLD